MIKLCPRAIFSQAQEDHSLGAMDTAMHVAGIRRDAGRDHPVYPAERDQEFSAIF